MATLQTSRNEPSVSVIVPALDEAKCIAGTLGALRDQNQTPLELIVADGGSVDGTPEIAGPLADLVIQAPRGRARQMNEAASRASGEVLWFVHADTVPGKGAIAELRSAVRRGRCWGRLRPRLSGRQWLFRVIERFIHWRAILTGISTGDQTLFVTRDAFDRVGGFPELPLMEDLAIARALRRMQWPATCRVDAITSSRRWERDGIWRTVALMWRLRLAWWFGADPERLARQYRGGRGGSA